MKNHLPPDPDAFSDPLSNYEPSEYASEIHRLLAEESVSVVPSTPFVQVAADATTEQAIQALHESKVSSLLVVDGSKLVGIFTERDVLEKAAGRLSELADQPVADVMTADPTVVYESDPVGTAVAAIAVAGHRHVPVLKMDGSVMGILSPKRVLSFLRTKMS